MHVCLLEKLRPHANMRGLHQPMTAAQSMPPAEAGLLANMPPLCFRVLQALLHAQQAGLADDALAAQVSEAVLRSGHPRLAAAMLASSIKDPSTLQVRGCSEMAALKAGKALPAAALRWPGWANVVC